MKYLKNIQKEKKIKTGTPSKRIICIEEKFSLCPYYSIKQLQKINTLRSKTIKKGQRKLLSAIFPIRKQVSTRNAFNQEAIL
jgi:hypothetical protein